MRKISAIALTGLATLCASAHPIDFDKIEHWTGSGPNRAALVVQFNGDIYGTDAYVWGYRWADGETPNGEIMMKAICANSSRLSMLTQYTGNMGSTVCGVGYSLNQELLDHLGFDFDKALESEFINFDYYDANSFMGQTSVPGDDTPQMAADAITAARTSGSHSIQHPFDKQAYGYPAYDYDCWRIDEALELRAGPAPLEPKWQAGWYEGYWSYWCADSSAQDWTYSGSGFTGRRLVNGSVEGWSYTQFEDAMVGGMGEGIAPCEDGAIFYMPPRYGVEADKAVRSIGEGVSHLPMIIRFGNQAKIDNVVVDLWFYDLVPGVDKIMETLSADPAFKFEGNTLSIDADGDGIFASSGSDASCSGEWTITEYEDCLMLSCDDKKPEYLLYLPATGQAAAVLPESMTFSLSDEKNYIPVFVQREAEYDAINYSWYRRTDTELSQTSTSSDIVKSVATAAATFGQLTYAGNKAGDLYIHVKVRTGKGSSFSFSNVCHFTLLPPEIPLQSISFAKTSVEAPLNSAVTNDYTLLPENATYTGLTYSSSDTRVATAAATAFRTTKTPGSATITVASAWNPEVKASFDVVSALRHPVTGFAIKDVEGDVIVLNPKQMLGIIADVTPADADIPDFNVTLEGNGTDRDNLIASMYKVNYWDEDNTRIQFYELSGHRAGECTLTLSSTDGSNVVKTYTVKVEEQDRTPIEGGYTDGTLLLNEEWFGHTNGGMNYLTPDGEMMYQVYERENPGMSFGATSQYGMIWADRLIVVSKQAVDGGDPLPGGGRVVVADAATLKRRGSIDDLMSGDETKSADGRAAVGATPSKVYVGSSNGIYIVNIDSVAVTGKIVGLGGEGSTDLYSGQIGDMVHAGRYVFGIRQNAGAFAIDPETDMVVREYELPTVQGITQSADGHVWIASVDGNGCAMFTCIDPETLETDMERSVVMPESVGAPTCSWGAWRSTPFVGCHSSNALWFSVGGGISGGSAKDKYFCWEIGSDPASVRTVFDMEVAGLTGSHPGVKQKTYGSPRYDDRIGQLIVMTTEDSASGHYRYNWTHFIDPATGEIVRTIALRSYYWFQAFAIFPDKHDAVIDVENFVMDKNDEAKVIDLAEAVTDADNIDANIRISLFEADTETEANAKVTLDGTMLTVTPISTGNYSFTLAAESNGRTSTRTVTVTVTDPLSTLENVDACQRSIRCDGQRLYVNGFAGHDLSICDISGRMVATMTVDADSYVFDFGAHKGVFVVSSDDDFATKVIIK